MATQAQRVQLLERRFSSLEAIRLRQPVLARSINGDDIRLARTVAVGTYPAAGNQFNIEFVNQTFPLTTGQQNATTTVRHPNKPVCRNVAGTMPPVGTFLIALRFGDRWFTNWCCVATEPADEVFASCVDTAPPNQTALVYLDNFTNAASTRPVATNGTVTGSGVLEAEWIDAGANSTGTAAVTHCYTLDENTWSVGDYVETEAEFVGDFANAQDENRLELGDIQRLGIVVKQGGIDVGASSYPAPVNLNAVLRVRVTLASAGQLTLNVWVDGALLHSQANIFYNAASFGGSNALPRTLAFAELRRIRPAGQAQTPAFGLTRFRMEKSWTDN